MKSGRSAAEKRRSVTREASTLLDIISWLLISSVFFCFFRSSSLSAPQLLTRVKQTHLLNYLPTYLPTDRPF
jgi:hypothetical protein